MSPTELMIHDMSRILTDLKVQNSTEDCQLIQRALTSLVKFAISQREIELLDGICDTRKVEEIRLATKQNI